MPPDEVSAEIDFFEPVQFGVEVGNLTDVIAERDQQTLGNVSIPKLWNWKYIQKITNPQLLTTGIVLTTRIVPANRPQLRACLKPNILYSMCDQLLFRNWGGRDSSSSWTPAIATSTAGAFLEKRKACGGAGEFLNSENFFSSRVNACGVHTQGCHQHCQIGPTMESNNGSATVWHKENIVWKEQLWGAEEQRKMLTLFVPLRSGGFSEAAGNNLGWKPHQTVRSTVNVPHQHVHVPVIPSFCQFQQFVETLKCCVEHHLTHWFCAIKLMFSRKFVYPCFGEDRTEAPEGPASHGSASNSFVPVFSVHLKFTCNFQRCHHHSTSDPVWTFLATTWFPFLWLVQMWHSDVKKPKFPYLPWCSDHKAGESCPCLPSKYWLLILCWLVDKDKRHPAQPSETCTLDFRGAGKWMLRLGCFSKGSCNLLSDMPSRLLCPRWRTEHWI